MFLNSVGVLMTLQDKHPSRWHLKEKKKDDVGKEDSVEEEGHLKPVARSDPLLPKQYGLSQRTDYDLHLFSNKSQNSSSK